MELRPQPGHFQSQSELAQQMGRSLAGVAAAHVQGPFAEYGGVNERLIPHSLTDIRAVEGQVTDGFHWHEGYVDIGQCLDVVVRPPQERVLKVDHVPFHVNGHDLPPTLASNLVAVSKAAKEQARVRRSFTVSHDVLSRSELLHGVGQAEDG